MQKEPISIYIHYPFCISKCPYCDFNSYVNLNIDENEFLNVYITEINYYHKLLQNRFAKTIFFGGGTPSLANSHFIEKILNEIEKLISRGNGIYDKPSWSPDGRLISFIKIANGQFYLGLMTPEGDSERYIMSDYLIEGVKWSPNSRYLIYTKQKDAFGQKSIPRIYIIDILTGNEYKLKTPENEGASDPDWIMNF